MIVYLKVGAKETRKFGRQTFREPKINLSELIQFKIEKN